MAGRTVSPSTSGVRPRMQKMFDGKNIATRPIPIIVDSSERRAIMAASADSRPLAEVVNMPSAPRAVTSSVLFGTVVPGSTLVRGGIYNPAVGGESTLGNM